MDKRVPRQHPLQGTRKEEGRVADLSENGA